jgi:hypothetical protein
MTKSQHRIPAHIRLTNPTENKNSTTKLNFHYNLSAIKIRANFQLSPDLPLESISAVRP